MRAGVGTKLSFFNFNFGFWYCKSGSRLHAAGRQKTTVQVDGCKQDMHQPSQPLQLQPQCEIDKQFYELMPSKSIMNNPAPIPEPSFYSSFKVRLPSSHIGTQTVGSTNDTGLSISLTALSNWPAAKFIRFDSERIGLVLASRQAS